MKLCHWFKLDGRNKDAALRETVWTEENFIVSFIYLITILHEKKELCSVPPTPTVMLFHTVILICFLI